jgi:hypothetical protein
MANKDSWLPTNKNIEDYSLSKDMLNSQRQEFTLLSKSKPDVQLNPMKIEMVNRVLKPLKEILKYEPSHKFLDILSEAILPTNSDVVLIISQYETAITKFYNKYYTEDKYKTDSYGRNYIRRWITQEFPPDYNATDESEDDDEYDEEDE